MKNLALAGALVLGLSHAADAATLLTVDLSVTNQITVTATDGLSAATVVSGSDGTGVYLENFYSAAATSFVLVNGSGNLTYAGTTSDGLPALFKGDVNDPGLNIFSISDDSLEFTAGQLAFTGSATWSVDAATYASLLAGPNSGSIFAPADSVDDVMRAALIGEWSRGGASAAIPLPAGAVLLLTGLGLMVVRSRRG